MDGRGLRWMEEVLKLHRGSAVSIILVSSNAQSYESDRRAKGLCGICEKIHMNR